MVELYSVGNPLRNPRSITQPSDTLLLPFARARAQDQLTAKQPLVESHAIIDREGIVVVEGSF